MTEARPPSASDATTSDGSLRSGQGPTRRLSAANLTISLGAAAAEPSKDADGTGSSAGTRRPLSDQTRPSRRGSTASAAAAQRSDLPGVVTVVGLTFAAVVVFGADRAELALIFDVLWGLAVLIALWRRPLRVNLLQVPSLYWIAGLFAALLGWVTLSLTSLAPSPPVNVWDWVGGGAGTIDKAMTLVELVKLIGLGAAFSTGVLLADTDRRAELTLQSLCAAGALYALFALLQHIVTPNRVLGAVKHFSPDRLTGTFLSPNVAAGFLGGIALLSLATLDAGPQVHATRTEGDVRFIMKYGALVLIFACLVLTASRLGAAAVMAGLIVAFGLSSWKERDLSVSLKSKAGVRLIVFGLFMLLAFAGQLLISRINQSDAGFSGRDVLFAEHLKAFLAAPITGYGLGSFSTVNDQLVTPETFYELWNIRAAHNVYLQWLEETGLIGSVLMFAVIGVIHWEILQGLRTRQGLVWLMRGVIGFSAVLLVQSFGDFTLQTPAISMLWALLLGLGFRAATGGSRAVEREALPTAPWMRTAAFWSPVAIAILAELTALLVLWSAGSKAAEDHFPLTLRTAYEQAALGRLSSRTKAGRIEARSEIVAALRQSPTDAYAWTMLAYLDGNSPKGLEELDRSYLSAPLAPNLVRWRAQLAADWWDDLPSDLRAKVIQELRAERTLDGVEGWLKTLPATSGNASFGLALSLALEGGD